MHSVVGGMSCTHSLHIEMKQTQEQKDGLALIELKLASAEKLVDECKDIADKLDMQFKIEFGGYGTGASYVPESQRHEYDEDPDSEVRTSGWYASSQSC
jgi:hypothetical protein